MLPIQTYCLQVRIKHCIKIRFGVENTLKSDVIIAILTFISIKIIKYHLP